jgi:hypothetical protein
VNTGLSLNFSVERLTNKGAPPMGGSRCGQIASVSRWRTGILRRKLILVGLATAGMAAVTLAWFLSANLESPVLPLTMNRRQGGTVDQTLSVLPTHILSDFFETKYAPAKRARFCVSSSNPAAIFVLATGVQILTESGWQPYSEEPRNEIWRLKPGTARDMYVEIPEKETKEIWRAYIRYGTEMHGGAFSE